MAASVEFEVQQYICEFKDVMSNIDRKQLTHPPSGFVRQSTILQYKSGDETCLEPSNNECLITISFYLVKKYLDQSDSKSQIENFNVSLENFKEFMKLIASNNEIVTNIIKQYFTNEEIEI